MATFRMLAPYYRAQRAAIIAGLGGATESDRFTDDFGGFTYLGTAWEYTPDVTKKGKVKVKGSVGATNVITNAEPALIGSGDAMRLQYGQAYNEFIYAEYLVSGLPSAGGAGAQNFFCGFTGDSNGSGAGSLTRLVAVGHTYNGSTWEVTTYTYPSSNAYPKTNDNGSINEVYTGEAVRVGILAETDGTRRVWSHIGGVWTTNGAQGGDPDSGGAGYPDAPDGGTGWLLPCIKAYTADGFSDTTFEAMAVEPLHTPALATIVIC